MTKSTGIHSELRAALRRYRPAFVTVVVLSAVLNVLTLGGALYMMMVYDSVLPSGSVPTLIGLLVLIIGVYAFQGWFDTLRTRILGDIGNGLDQDLSARVQQAMFDAQRRGLTASGDGLTPMRDLDRIAAFLGGAGPIALIDLPWISIFLLLLTLLHPWLGLTVLIGAAALVGLTVLTDRHTRAATAQLSVATTRRFASAETNLRHVELFSALGLQERMQARWERMNITQRMLNSNLNRTVGLYGGISRVARLFLQSLILTVGALLVIDGKATGGVIFAASILSGRALAPVDQAIGNWRAFAAARLGWHRLDALLAEAPAFDQARELLPRPSQSLSVEQLTVAPPGRTLPIIQNIAFSVPAGSGVAIIGASAAGKSTLARALLGIWSPVRGTVRLDGATLDQWPQAVLGGYMGYLPQTVELLDGTVAENIARFEPDAPADAIVAAAEAAGVHDMIVQFAKGYDTPVGTDGSALSAGQRQRIGLARALYKDPFLVLLDEPNSNLDAAGDEALEKAVAGVRARGGIAVLVTHRQGALSQVSHVLYLRGGKMEMFGPRDEVLARATAAALPGQQDLTARRGSLSSVQG